MLNKIERFYKTHEKGILIVVSIMAVMMFIAKNGALKSWEMGASYVDQDTYQHGYSEGVQVTELKYIGYHSPDEYRAVQTEVQFKNEAKSIAKVLYGFSGYNLSPKAKTAIVEVILSRVECPYGEFGDTIIEVCEKEKQWEGYTGNYLEEDYRLVLDILNTEDRGRVTPTGCLFLTCSYGKVTVRTEWNSKSGWEVS